MCARKRFIPVNRKVTAIIIATLAVGLGILILYFATSLTKTIEESTEENLSEQSQILYTAIENFMLPGEAPLAVSYFEEIEAQNPLSSIKLFRSDGTEAFTDNSTILEVNEQIGANSFPRQERAGLKPESRDDRQFELAVEKPPVTSVFRERSEDGAVLFRIYKPLINKPKCASCHGSSHTIRGVLDIRTDITSSVIRQRNTVIVSASIFLAGILVLSLILSRFMQTTILKPVEKVRDVCIAVTKGNFSRRVSYKKNDEIGELGTTVNEMVEGLHERYELSKYVSSSTLESLQESSEGREVELTLLFSDIRGFTSYSEQNEAELVVRHLNNILGRQSEIIIENGGDIDKYVGDEILALFTGADGVEAACKTAMEIQYELERESKEFDSLKVGIGIHYGTVILGMIGSQRRADYTVIGDNVNTASRLCSAAKAGEVIVSQSAEQKVPLRFHFDGPFKARVKGKARYIAVYKLRTV